MLSKLDDYFYFMGTLYRFNPVDGFKKVSEEEGVPMSLTGLLPTNEVENRVKYIQGKVLTVIDAVISDKQQNKATKDIINQVISNELYRLTDSASGVQTLSTGDMVQFSGSVEKFYEENSPKELQ